MELITFQKFKSKGYKNQPKTNWNLKQLKIMAVELGIAKTGTKEKLYKNITKAFELDPTLEIDLNNSTPKISKKSTAKEKKRSNDCQVINRPKNGYCPKNKPILSKTLNNFDCCFAKPKFQSIKKIAHLIGENHEKQLSNLLRKGFLIESSKGLKLNNFNQFDNYKIIIYDLETTGRPMGDLLPDITQIAMYNPQTNDFYTSYFNPTQSIDPIAS
jgi:hypothetical protein